ncbi:uncharacterized protein SPPG_05420 [Spizellomyces punctatus DAOM BR117]|uniref:Uncharacterized protein n=1 Tax=Spizellomyces punctatus (strain DAOM BR117) TaxID=645134 RepID=A0A0L0HDS2_SPIPD|nr:uncharacterized protein SPPG_05420 [Spizellomyces punctatus DAOM BR117]KNC99166.1 hypothetical protein SPPG_05420 [Spizellomyces punctatus DAOM BR117]|eukprot:XP_016607206.1 hypothetical protein SPPG_05420 [Spizellomyces punctatus DAOM BR117]
MSSHKRQRDHDQDRDIEKGRHGRDKQRKHRKSKREGDDVESEVDDEAATARRYGRPAINEDDYFVKSTEFQLWLRQEKKLFFNDLSGAETRTYFDKFVKRWNRGKLQKRYYEGISTSEVPAAERSRHKWNFKNLNEDALANARDSVDSLTQSSKQLNRPLDVLEQKSRAAAEARSKSRLERDDDLDKAEQERIARKREQRNMRKDQEMVLEELAPKATGRDALIEKRRAQNAYHKQERDVDVELNDRDLMGGDSLASYKRAHERREERKKERRDERSTEMAGKVAAYRAKEDATLAMFKQLAQNRFGSGGG